MKVDIKNTLNEVGKILAIANIDRQDDVLGNLIINLQHTENYIEQLENRNKELEEENKELKEWNQYYDEQFAERNKNAWRVLAKAKKIKETDLINLSEIDVWIEIENILEELLGG